MKFSHRVTSLALAVFLLLSPLAHAGLSFSTLQRENSGSETKITGTISFDSSYPTGGESVDLAQLGLTNVTAILFESKSGYTFNYDLTNSKVLVYNGAGFTPAGTNSTSAVTGTGTFTGTASTAAVTTAFSGTGQSSAGQVITTTDNQTMTLNQCANMWFVSATHGPYLIASNTAVTGAPAVLTVIGDAPATDAGAYVIVKDPTPAGAVSALSGTAAAQTFTGTAVPAGSLSESANTTNLSSLTGVRFVAYGK